MDNEPQLMHPPWAKDGSIYVFRKLRQFVPEFDR
jgi:deferrochelatase/peroxidase EfeB